MLLLPLKQQLLSTGTHCSDSDLCRDFKDIYVTHIFNSL